MQAALDFVYQSKPARIVFGSASLQYLEREIQLIGARRVMILCTPGQRKNGEALAQRLGGLVVCLCDQAAMHVPVEVVNIAHQMAISYRVDCAIALGGGSTIGLGKAIALESPIPIIAIPTTYAGSEMTAIYGLTENGLKRTGTDARVLPRTVIYDPDLTLSLPVELSITSGINAIAHAAEALYSKDANPIVSLMAEEGIRALATGLRGIYADTANSSARESALYGAWLCGTVLGSVGMSLHHKLCHTLGGSFNLPHAQTHTVILPHVLAYNAAAAPHAMRRIARALGADNAADGVYQLARTHGAQMSLHELGMAQSDVDRASEIACANPYWNPRPIERTSVRTLLQNAFEGILPNAE